MIPVTKPYLPPKAEFDAYIADIWQRNWLTNNGPLVNDLELKLKKYLAVNHLLFLSNGTIALQIALKALNIKKEVITTPFSYVATTSSIVWEGCTPIFADIDEKTLNIDPLKIENLITENTEAILATHCFGNSCDINAIKKIADKYDLKVIYDAAHCFGTTYNNQSIFHYGDISTTSFHATKLFHTVEGGAVFTSNAEVLKKMSYLRNFGHDGPDNFRGVGINGKNSEFHAAMGITNLKYIKVILTSRKEQSLIYDSWLLKTTISKPVIQEGTNFNYAYYPVIFESNEIMLKVKNELERAKIFPRRYFYPSLSSLSYVNQQATPISDDIADRILCLPLYHTLSEEEQELVCRIIIRTLNYN